MRATSMNILKILFNESPINLILKKGDNRVKRVYILTVFISVFYRLWKFFVGLTTFEGPHWGLLGIREIHVKMYLNLHNHWKKFNFL